MRRSHKLQIESIVRRDKLTFVGGSYDDYPDDDVVSRYPKTFENVEPEEASDYYREVWIGKV